MVTRRDGILLALAALPRVLYLLLAEPPFEGPYWLLSSELLRHGSFGVEGGSSTEFEPVYPVFLAAARILMRDHAVGVQLVQIAVSSIGALVLHRLCLVLTGSSRVAAIAAVLYAGDLLLIKQSVGQSPFVLVTTLLVVLAYSVATATTTRSAIVAGLILGCLVLTRAMTLPLLACMALILGARLRPRTACAAMLAVLVVIVPWSLRGYRLNESWWPTRSGLNLFIGSLPAAAALVPDHDVDLLVPSVDAVLLALLPGMNDESPKALKESDRMLTRLALANLSARPLQALEEKARNLGYFFWPPIVPYYIHGPDTRVVVEADGTVSVANAVSRSRTEVALYVVSYSTVLAAAGWGLMRRRSMLVRRDLMLVCMLGTFALTHAVYFPATRYRGPVTFILIFYAAVAVEEWFAPLLNRLADRASIAHTPPTAA